MMGSTKDPKDGKAVATTVFSAVAVYAVRIFPTVDFSVNESMSIRHVSTSESQTHPCIVILGFPGLLRFAGVSTYYTTYSRHHHSIIGLMVFMSWESEEVKCRPALEAGSLGVWIS